MAEQSRGRFLDRLERIRSGSDVALVYPDDTVEEFEGDVDLEAVVDELDVELQLTGRTVWGKKLDAPALVIEPAVAFGRQLLTMVGVFSRTTKMRCASFSLPAGPPRLGGTCPQSDNRKLMEPGRQFICAGCYAVGGNFLYRSSQFRQLVRKRWGEESLAEGTFADELIAALEVFTSKPRLGVDHAYFRIHDSGDFGGLGPAYFRAWCEISATFSDVLFWAPTRDWVSRRWRAIMSDRPPNLIIRPSALHVDDPAPDVEGLDAGSTAAAGTTRQLQAREVAAWSCPAYTVAGKSCQDAGCRVC